METEHEGPNLAAVQAGTQPELKPVPVIFLDINGVLKPKSALSIATFGKAFGYLSPIAVGLVNRLCYETGAVVVISSSWRVYDQRPVMQRLRESITSLNGLLETGDEEIQFYIKFFCYPPEPAKSWCTPVLGDGSHERRGEEIDWWLKKWGHMVESYCILEDRGHILPHQYPHFVHIQRNKSGLDAEYYAQALEILTDKLLKLRNYLPPSVPT